MRTTLMRKGSGELKESGVGGSSGRSGRGIEGSEMLPEKGTCEYGEGVVGVGKEVVITIRMEVMCKLRRV